MVLVMPVEFTFYRKDKIFIKSLFPKIYYKPLVIREHGLQANIQNNYFHRVSFICEQKQQTYFAISPNLVLNAFPNKVFLYLMQFTKM